jgi:hypothetical protein
MHIENIENLEEHIDQIDIARDNILNKWMDKPIALDVLQKYNITDEHFMNDYGSKIINYYIDVVKGRVRIGNCPVVRTMLLDFKELDIQNYELYSICSQLRVSLIEIIFELEIESKELVSEASYVFDMNFGGVLKMYEELKDGTHQES